jgi:hypothetical protein
MRNTIQGCREVQEVAPDAFVPAMMVAGTPLPVPVTSKRPAVSGSAASVNNPALSKTVASGCCEGRESPIGSASDGRGQSPHVLRSGDREAVGSASILGVWRPLDADRGAVQGGAPAHEDVGVSSSTASIVHGRPARGKAGPGPVGPVGWCADPDGGARRGYPSVAACAVARISVRER